MKRAIRLIFFALLLFTAFPVSSQGPGLYETPLIGDEGETVGVTAIWNSPKNIHVKIFPNEEWRITDTQTYVGLLPPPVAANGQPVPGQFPYLSEHQPPALMWDLVLSLQDDLGITSSDSRIYVYIAVHGDLVKLDEFDIPIDQTGFWMLGSYPLGKSMYGSYEMYLLALPAFLE